MSPRLAPTLLPLAAVSLLAPAALAQTPPPEGAPPPDPGQIIVVVPQGPPPVYLPPPVVAPYPVAPYPTVIAPYPTAPPSPPPDVARTHGFTAKVWAGPAYRRLFDVSIYGADVGLGFGGQHGRSGFYGNVSGLFARTDQGLPTYQIRPGFNWEYRIDRVHLGLGLEVGFLAIKRATTGDFMTGLGVGALASITVDLVQTDGHALYLGAKMSGEILTGSSNAGDQPVLWGPSAMLGWRY